MLLTSKGRSSKILRFRSRLETWANLTFFFLISAFSPPCSAPPFFLPLPPLPLPPLPLPPFPFPRRPWRGRKRSSSNPSPNSDISAGNQEGICGRSSSHCEHTEVNVKVLPSGPSLKLWTSNTATMAVGFKIQQWCELVLTHLPAPSASSVTWTKRKARQWLMETLLPEINFGFLEEIQIVVTRPTTAFLTSPPLVRCGTTATTTWPPLSWPGWMLLETGDAMRSFRLSAKLSALSSLFFTNHPHSDLSNAG